MMKTIRYNLYMDLNALELIQDIDKTKIGCYGSWELKEISHIQKSIKELNLNTIQRVCIIDFSMVEEFDSAGIVLLIELKKYLEKSKIDCKIIGLNRKQIKLFKLLNRGYDEEPLPKREEGVFYQLGKATITEIRVIIDFLYFLGQLWTTFIRLLITPSKFRFKETIYHIEHSGMDALFIVGLTSLLVGLVIAYESLIQLRQFGADIFVVDGIGLIITREIGPMITAIIIAGRSASSYTAEIASMKITEEISAMKTMGFDPFYFLIIPRILALMIAIPLLIVFSDLAGILGGMIATKAQVNISFSFFISRLQEVISVKQYILGVIKGPFFAIIIASTGCFHGLRVSGNTESIGIETTASVVHSIFFVIACDALFAILYTQLGY